MSSCDEPQSGDTAGVIHSFMKSQPTNLASPFPPVYSSAFPLTSQKTCIRMNHPRARVTPPSASYKQTVCRSSRLTWPCGEGQKTKARACARSLLFTSRKERRDATAQIQLPLLLGYIVWQSCGVGGGSQNPVTSVDAGCRAQTVMELQRWRQTRLTFLTWSSLSSVK